MRSYPRSRCAAFFGPEGFVEDGNLTQTIYTLRWLLDPDGDGRAFIETVPRRGYRFAAAVTVVAAPVPAPAPATVRWRLAFATAAIVVLMAVALVAAAQSPTTPYPWLGREAAREYALGRYYWDKRTLAATRTSLSYFGDVVRLAPNSCLGYAGIGDAWEMVASHMMLPGNPKQYYDKAERYAQVALSHDPHCGEARTTLGYVAFNRDRDRDRAEREFRAALAFRPLQAPAHEFLGAVALLKGNIGEANDELARAAELDPSNSPILTWLGVANYYAHRFDQARVALRQAIDLDARNADALYHLVLTDERLGRTSEAYETLAKFRVAVEAMNEHGPAAHDKLHALTALVALRAGDQAKAERAMPDLTPRAKAREHAVLYAALCSRLGRRDEALEWIQIGLQDEDTKEERNLLPADPELAEIATDARFKALLS